MSSAPTNSDSVELFVLSFCFMDVEITEPYPNVLVPPVWLLQSL